MLIQNLILERRVLFCFMNIKTKKMVVLERKLQEFGNTLELISVEKSKERYGKIDELIYQIRNLIFGKEKNGVFNFLYNDIESALRTFRDKYKDLLKSLGIHICVSSKLIYRKKRWWKKKNKIVNKNQKLESSLYKRQKIYCKDCGQFHYVNRE